MNITVNIVLYEQLCESTVVYIQLFWYLRYFSIKWENTNLRFVSDLVYCKYHADDLHPTHPENHSIRVNENTSDLFLALTIIRKIIIRMLKFLVGLSIFYFYSI